MHPCLRGALWSSFEGLGMLTGGCHEVGGYHESRSARACGGLCHGRCVSGGGPAPVFAGSVVEQF